MNATNQNYSNREIDHMFQEIKESLSRIEIQTSKHNGRLSKLERWMWTLAGGIIVVAFLFPTFNTIYSQKIEQVEASVRSFQSSR